MKKKLLIVLLTVIAVLCCAFGFAACGDNTGNTSDGSFGGNEIPDGGHVDTDPDDEDLPGNSEKPGSGGNGGNTDPDDGDISGDNTEKVHIHDYGTVWKYDASKHWHECNNDGCDEKIIDEAAHTDKDNDGFCDVCRYEVGISTVSVERVTLDVTALTLEIGDSKILTATVLPDNATDKSVVWSTSDSSVVTVTDGTVIAVSAGTATVSVTASDGQKSAQCSITVNKRVVPADSVSLNVTSAVLMVGEELTLSATVSPDDAEDKTVTWSSSDREVVTVSDGTVTAVAEGRATVTVRTENGKTAQCSFTVGELSFAEVVSGSEVVSYEVNGIGTLTSATVLNIPSVHNGKPVTGIARDAFRNESQLTSVSIPESVTSVGGFAFYNCTQLKTVNIAARLTSIEDWTFYKCSLESFTIPEGVVSVGNSAFESCTKMVSVTVPASIETIGTNAFRSCDSLNEVHIAGLAEWCAISFGETGSNPLSYAGNLYCNGAPVYDLVIPDGVTRINDKLFESCSNIMSVTIPESVMYIGQNAFNECTGLKEVYFPDLGKWLGISFGGFFANPLYYAESLIIGGKTVIELTVPEQVTAVGDYAFYGYATLTGITFHENVTSVGESAFYSCINVTDVYFPENMVAVIGDAAFYNCAKLTEVTLPDGITLTEGTQFAGCINLEKISASAAAFSNIYKDYLKSVVITSGDSIKSSEFYNLSKLESITIADSVTAIGDFAFFGCVNIESATIPAFAATAIPKAGLKTVVITSGDIIAELSFYDAVNMERISLPDSIEVIDKMAFQNSKSLLSIKIPANVTTIGDYAFFGCAALTSLTIPDSVKTIGELAFGTCENVKSLIISKNVTSIGAGAFGMSPETVTMPVAAIKYVSQSALKTVVISGGDTIVANAFRSCYALESITLAESVTTIEAEAFRDCVYLSSVTFGKDIATIGRLAFYNCATLNRLTFTYEGTSAQWEAVDKAEYWEGNLNDYVVNCLGDSE